ncbi:PorV/PorQ family protein [Nibribacter ruber]|uniref:PorV/PorQ family protein n=1 Tax=Nibribacter ruber TaxID=2698458 RepID=A0A6P1NYG8_9BACT|nr:PorV/PorQ family protein [Nibribacter ruber]QHL87008.1 PorV/PorQ family protein [Nibribacter ruber]
MPKRLLPVFFLSLSLLIATSVQAQEVSAPKYSNEFLNIGVGARALGMGGVQSAIVRDVTSGVWNPAGLMGLKNRHNVGYMHSELFAGIIKNDFGAYATTLDSSSALAVSVIRLGVDDIADTRRLQNEYGAIQYDSIEYFSVADYAFIASYARKSNWLPGLTLGANAKVIYRNVGDFANAWGFGFDLGAQLQRGSWQFGIMAKDITTTFTAWKLNPDELESTYLKDQESFNANSIEITLPRLILGVGRSFQVSEKFSALVATDLDVTFDGKRNTLLSSNAVSIDPRVGVELGYANTVFLRGGLNNVQQIEDLDGSSSWKVQPNFGIGFASYGLMLDLALSKVAADSKTSSVIVSLGYSFD